MINIAPTRLAKPALLTLAFMLGSAGCASNWESTFEPASASVYPPTERVIIREVPWERIDSVLRDIDSSRASSDTHPDEWTPAQHDAEKSLLVTALQLSEDPASLEILGRSVFTSTANVNLFDGSLSAFGRSIGADYAIWSTSYLGKAQTVQREPVTTTGFGYSRHHRRDGHADYDYMPYQETVYVPVVVERDEFAWLVFFVRTLK